MTDHDPFSGTDHIGLEVSHSGPYAVLERPWSVGNVPDPPRPFFGILITAPAFSGVRLTARVRRIGGRFSVILVTGDVHLRGFDRGGQMLWSGNAARISPMGMEVGSGAMCITFDLLPPMTFVEHRSIPVDNRQPRA